MKQMKKKASFEVPPKDQQLLGSAVGRWSDDRKGLLDWE